MAIPAVDQEFLQQFKQTKPSNSGLVNLEKQGLNNLWFSHAGQYDRQHGGTFGDATSQALLAELNTTDLGFKPQISAGYANIGHSDGKGGEHRNPGVFDIGLGGRNTKEAAALKQFLQQRGVEFLEEDPGSSNWHLHVRGNKKKKTASVHNDDDAAFLAQFRTDQTPTQKLAGRTVRSLQAPPPVVKPETNFMGDLAAGATFGATAGRVDNPRGHGVGNFIGESLGPLLPTGLGALAGTAIGGPIGGIIGGAGAGGATFAGIEEARQRAAGQTPDIGKIALEGGIGAVSSALPILRGGRLATQIAKNAALSGGIEGLGSVARQSMDGKGIDLGRTLSDAGQGAVFGGALGAVFGKVHAKHPEIAAKLEANEPLQPNELAKVKQILDPAELQQLQESWRSRTVGETPKIETGPFNEQQALDDILNKPGVEQVSDSGVLAAREMGKREVPTIEPGRALPEGQAIELGKPGVRSSSILDPQTGKPFEPETTYLRSSKDIALEKAQQVGRDSGVILSPERDLGRPGGPPSPRPAIDLGRPVEGSRPGILDPQGRAIGETPRDVSLTEPMPEARPLLDAQGRELGRPTPQPQELGRPDTTSAIAPEADTFTPQGATPEQTSTLRQELEQQVQQRGGQLMKIADAEQFMRGRSGQQHGLNFLEAGRNNQQIDISYTPLGEGRASTKTRTISPFGIERRVIKPGTELNNLKRQFGSYAAVRDHLIQKAREAGQTVNAGSITTKPASLKAAIERLGMNEHVYLHSHNFGETTVGTGKSERGYRLDTITDSSLTGQKANIPVGAYQNEIAPALQALDQLASLEGAPPLFKRAVTQIQKGEISRATVKELKAALADDAGLAAQFCKSVGLKL